MRTDGEKARILVADDDLSVRDVVSRRLLEAGYECTVAADGTSALRKLRAHQFDLALLDIRMPGKLGTDVLKEIQAKYPDTAAIMITAISDVETAISSMRSGAYDYIVKPVNFNMLMVSVDGALEKRRLILENREYQVHLEEKVQEQTDMIRRSFLNSITSLAYALEAKDKYTSGHSRRVTETAVAVARELDMSEDKVEKIRLAGLLHDVGKIGVRESILNKQGKLTHEEYRHIMSHAEIGERILSPVVEHEEILKMVRHHHERYDGTGYPDGLSGEEIPQGAMVLAVADAYSNLSDNSAQKQNLPQGARILAVADAYDAMTSDRPYRQGMSPEDASAELERGKGKQFDPVVVNAFLRMMQKTTDYTRPEISIKMETLFAAHTEAREHVSGY
ncbi:MAG: response regulator [Dehalococcoidia bacterium]|nr:response regulator [Dehalococcoidia bacterium]